MVKVVTIKTATSMFKRPINKLCFLPVELEYSRATTTSIWALPGNEYRIPNNYVLKLIFKTNIKFPDV